jgi:hypothetical protein
MKKQIVQATGNADQSSNEKADTASIDPPLSDFLFFIQIADGCIDHRIAQR